MISENYNLTISLIIILRLVWDLNFASGHNSCMVTPIAGLPKITPLYQRDTIAPVQRGNFNLLPLHHTLQICKCWKLFDSNKPRISVTTTCPCLLILVSNCNCTLLIARRVDSVQLRFGRNRSHLPLDPDHW